MDNNTFNKIRLLAYLSIFCLYIVHYIYCSLSALPDFSNYFINSDMYVNLRWVESIIEQGPLNPEPFHPYTDWMQPIAPFSTWISWWGTSAIFQQSPLYTYFLAVILKVTGSILTVHFLQMLMGFFLCICIGILAKEVSNNRVVGLIASVIAGLYAPFYVYSWPLLRDVLSWLITAIFAICIIRWWRAWDGQEYPSVRLSMNLGIMLALGLLVRESFNLFVIIVVLAGTFKAIRHQIFKPILCVLIAFTLLISPLIVRNALTGAPLLSTSNRFAEAYIFFNVPSASGLESKVPLETKSILERSGGKAWPTVLETMALYNNDYLPWIQKMAKKFISLLDPFEAPDNINIYYVKLISPVANYGISHTIVIVLGLYGLILCFLKREKGWGWFFVLLLCLLANVVIFSPFSRYRQILCIFWIPLASYYLYFMLQKFSPKRIMGLLLIPVGVYLCIYISPKRTLWNLYRVQEFSVSEAIYKARGDDIKAREQRELFYKLVKYNRTF